MKRIIYTAAVMLTPVLAFAASEGGEHGYNWGSLFKNFGYRSIVFVVLVVILYKLLKKPVLNFLDNRTDDIKKAIKDAETAAENAKTELTNYEIKMKSFESDLEAMKEKSMAAADTEKKIILDDAAKQIEKLQDFAESLIESEKRKAVEDLKNEVVVKALEAAYGRLGEELTAEKQKQLLNEYIKKIGVLN